MTEHLSTTPPNTAKEFLETYSRMMTTLLEEEHITEEMLLALVTVARWNLRGIPAWSGNAASFSRAELADKVQQGLAAWLLYRTSLEEDHSAEALDTVTDTVRARIEDQ